MFLFSLRTDRRLRIRHKRRRNSPGRKTSARSTHATRWEFVRYAGVQESVYKGKIIIKKSNDNVIMPLLLFKRRPQTAKGLVRGRRYRGIVSAAVVAAVFRLWAPRQSAAGPSACERCKTFREIWAYGRHRGAAFGCGNPTAEDQIQATKETDLREL